MHVPTLEAPRRNCLRPLAALLVAATSVGCWADEPSPWYVGASAAYTHDSNVFRERNARGDSYWSTGLLGGFDQMIGRQRVYATGSAQFNRFQDFKQLNNTTYGLAAGLDLTTIERLSASLRYDANQALVNYADANLLTPAALSIKDLQKTQRLSATARYGSNPGLALNGGVEHRTVDYSAVEDKRDYSQDVVHAGVTWGKSELLTLGVGVRFTKGDYPQAVISPAIPEVPPSNGNPGSPRVDATFGHDKSDRRDVDFTAVWSPTGVSTLSGRLSLGRETHTQPTIPTFSGFTGALFWTYKPAGRLTYKASLSRDTASENTFSNLPPGTLPVRSNNNRLTTVATVDANYELTGKTALNASLRYDDGSVSSVDGAVSNSATYLFGIGATYQATRSIGLACNLSHETRRNAYGDTVASCSAQIVLR